MRAFLSGFILVTAIPPFIAAGACAAVRQLGTNGSKRATHTPVWQTCARGRQRRRIIPAIVSDADKCRYISGEWMARLVIYIQPIDCPTVPKGTERLRITPSPVHSLTGIDPLVAALEDLWAQ